MKLLQSSHEMPLTLTSFPRYAVIQPNETFLSKVCCSLRVCIVKMFQF